MTIKERTESLREEAIKLLEDNWTKFDKFNKIAFSRWPVARTFDATTRNIEDADLLIDGFHAIGLIKINGVTRVIDSRGGSTDAQHLTLQKLGILLRLIGI